MIWMEPLRGMMYLCSPGLRSLQELEEPRMRLSDFAPQDPTRDLLLLNQQRLAGMEQLERKEEELRPLYALGRGKEDDRGLAARHAARARGHPAEGGQEGRRR